MQTEWKTLPLHEAKVAEGDFGSISGYVSTFNGVDSYGDTIIRGAYAKWLPKFLSDGFLAWSHDWENLIGMPVAAQEDDHGLYLVADFHSHADAQKARSTAAERLAKGLRMGLSIGYRAHKWSFKAAEDGQEQLRVLEEIELFEGSLVAVPADERAMASGVKSAPLTHRPGLGENRFADHGERVLLDLKSYISRATDLSELRAKEGRVLSEANRRRLASLLEELDALGGVRTEIEELLASTEPQKAAQSDLTLLRLQFDHTRALLGV